MTELRHELAAAGVSAARFLEAVVVTDHQEGGVTRIPEGQVIVPLATNIPFRVELARYLLELSLHYDPTRPLVGEQAG